LGVARLQNGLAPLQNAFTALQNGLAPLQNAFAALFHVLAVVRGAIARLFRRLDGLLGFLVVRRGVACAVRVGHRVAAEVFEVFLHPLHEVGGLAAVGRYLGQTRGFEEQLSCMPFLVIISGITKMRLFYCHTRYFGSVHCFCGLKILILNGSGLQIQTSGTQPNIRQIGLQIQTSGTIRTSAGSGAVVVFKPSEATTESEASAILRQRPIGGTHAVAQVSLNIAWRFQPLLLFPIS